MLVGELRVYHSVLEIATAPLGPRNERRGGAVLRKGRRKSVLTVGTPVPGCPREHQDKNPDTPPGCPYSFYQLFFVKFTKSIAINL